MGPLAGLRIVEMAGLGPAPMCAMLLADLGATVLRVERKTASGLGVKRPRKYDLLLRGRDVITLDLKSEVGIEVALQLIGRADALIEGFRPGVMERLGLGPEPCLDLNPKLIYGRMTGWGQDGPLAQTAGHDINYIAITGALHAIGSAEQPAIPLNLVGDYGGGALYLAMGILAGIIEARGSGRGQVVDAAIVDGTASLMTSFCGLVAAGIWTDKRQSNFADGAAPFYEIYTCADGKQLSVGPIEGKFLAILLDRLDLDAAALPAQHDKASWPIVKGLFAERFAQQTRDEWCARFDGSDACVAPVLSINEAPAHPHLRARETYIEVDGVVQPAPAPRFSRTKPGVPSAPKDPEPDRTASALASWLPDEEVTRYAEAGAFE